MTKKEFEKLLTKELNFDINIRYYAKDITLYYITSLIDSLQYNLILKTLNQTISYSSFKKNLLQTSFQEHKNIEDCLNNLYSGNLIIIYKKHILSIDIRFYQTRGIEEPENEKTVFGSKDGFNESINTNISLIRRRIRSKHLKFEYFNVSTYSNNVVLLSYMDNEVNNYELNMVRKKINSLKLTSLIMSERSIEELILKQEKTIFPLVRFTSRPDVASISIIKGKILILVDNSSYGIILPSSLFEHLVSVEEYKEVPLSGTLTRFIRSISVLASILLLPIYICLRLNTVINNHIISLKPYENSNIFLLCEILIIMIIYEVFRIAYIHTPNTFNQGISFVIAIVLGEISLNLGIFEKEVLLVTSLSMLFLFATPSYELSLTNRIVLICLVILSTLFNYVGLLIGILILFIHLLNINTFNKPYLYPLCPFDFDAFKNIFKRRNVKGKKKL